jgi:hypothetical protein
VTLHDLILLARPRIGLLAAAGAAACYLAWRGPAGAAGPSGAVDAGLALAAGGALALATGVSALNQVQ